MTSLLVVLLSGAVLLRPPLGRVAQVMAALALVMALVRIVPGGVTVLGLGEQAMPGRNEVLVLGLIAAGYLIGEARWYSLGVLMCFLALGLAFVLLLSGLAQQHEVIGKISPASAVMSGALALSVAAKHANRGVMRVLLGPHASGRNARMQLLAGILTPIVLGAIFMSVPGWSHGQGEVLLLIAALTGFNIALIVVTAMSMERADHKRRQLERKMAMLALHDGLTRVHNRVMLERRFDRAVAQSARAAFCFLMIDLDHFKAINDQGGHALGDCVLQQVARALRAQLRAGDCLARIGGEEFALILPATSLAQGHAMGERLRGCVAETRVRCGDGSAQRVTASVGVAQWSAGESLLQIYARTDQALYAAKQAGRNRVALAERPGAGAGAEAGRRGVTGLECARAARIAQEIQRDAHQNVA